MVLSHKKIIKVSLLVIYFIIFFSVPFYAVKADFQDRCWLKGACEDGSDTAGIWGCKEGDADRKNCASYNEKFGDRYSNYEKLSAECSDVGGQPTALCFISEPTIVLQVGIPGISEKYCSNYKLGESPKSCSQDSDCGNGQCRPGIKNGFPGYLQSFFNFFIPAIAVMSVVMIMWGGFKRIAAAGSSETIKGANETIFAAISGLILALISYTLLNLINPALVTNSLSPIEKVKPETMGFCPAYYNNKSLYQSGWYEYECRGATSPYVTRCVNDDDCKISSNGSKCLVTQTMSTASPGSSCGRKFVLNGKECIGKECLDDGYGCFKDERDRYHCSQMSIKGSMSGGEVNNIALLYICNNGDDHLCMIDKPGSAAVGDSYVLAHSDYFIGVESQGAYAIGNCYSNKTIENGQIVGYKPIFNDKDHVCKDAGGVKGLALAIEVEQGGIFEQDDWYAVDASSCLSSNETGVNVKRIIDGNNNDKPILEGTSQLDVNNDNPGGNMDWATVDSSTLFQFFDSSWKRTPPITCSINVNDTNFPDR